MSIIIGIDHGYYAIKTEHCSFSTGLTSYGEHEPYPCKGKLQQRLRQGRKQLGGNAGGAGDTPLRSLQTAP